MNLARLLAGTQAAVFIGTGAWPIVSLRSFEAVTGRKRDGWLVQSMGALITAVGASLALGARKKRISSETALIGASAAVALCASDLVFVSKRRIPRVYLADAIMEAMFAAGWLAALPKLVGAAPRAPEPILRDPSRVTEAAGPAAEQRPPSDS